MPRYNQILRRVYNEPWAILPDKLEVIDLVVQLRLGGDKASPEEIREAMGAAPQQIGSPPAAVAVLPLFGIITQHAGLMTEYSGGTSTEAFGRAFRRALADPQVGRIVIHAHTPGGSVYGVQELSDLIYRARGQKPIETVVSSLMASAGYWIGSAADSITVTPGGDVGSIGVVAMHTDISQAEEAAGLKTTLVAKPAKKVLGSPYEPLSEEAREEIERAVADTYEEFVAAVARNRGAKKSDVKNGYAGGGVVGAKEAVQLGMADRIATLDDVISGAARRGRASQRNRNALRLAEC